jgi:hypothetical protein
MRFSWRSEAGPVPDWSGPCWTTGQKQPRSANGGCLGHFSPAGPVVPDFVVPSTNVGGSPTFFYIQSNPWKIGPLVSEGLHLANSGQMLGWSSLVWTSPWSRIARIRENYHVSARRNVGQRTAGRLRAQSGDRRCWAPGAGSLDGGRCAASQGLDRPVSAVLSGALVANWWQMALGECRSGPRTLLETADSRLFWPELLICGQRQRGPGSPPWVGGPGFARPRSRTENYNSEVSK